MGTRNSLKKIVEDIEKFNAELKAFANETEDYQAVLYEDSLTMFSIQNIALSPSGKYLTNEYDYIDGKGFHTEKELVNGDIEEIRSYLNFWKACLRRAKRYWAMDTDTLDAIMNFRFEKEGK